MAAYPGLLVHMLPSDVGKILTLDTNICFGSVASTGTTGSGAAKIFG